MLGRLRRSSQTCGNDSGIHPAIFQAALLEEAEATKASIQAVQAITAQQQQQQVQFTAHQPTAVSSPTGSGGQTVDWSKLINKPPLLDGKSIEDEIWSWQANTFGSSFRPQRPPLHFGSLVMTPLTLLSNGMNPPGALSS